MAQEEWITPPQTGGDSYAAPVAYTPAAPSPLPADPRPPAPAYQLRPLSLGEILDRTFSVYRSNFWLFAGISCFSGVVRTLLSGVQLAVMHFSRKQINPTVFGLATIAVYLVLGLAFFFAYSITQAATVDALSKVYLGEPASIKQSFQATIGKWYRYLSIALWQMFSFLWIPALLFIVGGIVLVTRIPGAPILGGLLLFLGALGGIAGYILYLRNSLGVPITVVEGLPVTASMRRSKLLTEGAKVKIFVAGLLAGALDVAVALIQSPLTIFLVYTVARGHESIATQIAILLVNFAGYSVVGPVLMISLSLIYFDQRVRLEALDLVMLMGAVPATPATANVPPTPLPEVVTSPAPVEAEAGVPTIADSHETSGSAGPANDENLL